MGSKGTPGKIEKFHLLAKDSDLKGREFHHFDAMTKKAIPWVAVCLVGIQLQYIGLHQS